MHHMLTIARELIPDMARTNTRRAMRLLATRPDRLEERLKNELNRLFGKARRFRPFTTNCKKSAPSCGPKARTNPNANA
jgi:hypothetical protein